MPVQLGQFGFHEQRLRWWFDAVGNASSGRVHVPIWAMLVPVAALTAWLWRRERPRPNHCCLCGYNLTGNTTGRCPECGSPCPDELGPQTGPSTAPGGSSGGD